ncbi:MAG: PEP-CTERM sorting domain-containing protein [Planctomycetaceae bacterium]|nr:PEP-CTERM sorting domain-containing protein [Planctomycetaceae bacterium]
MKFITTPSNTLTGTNYAGGNYDFIPYKIDDHGDTFDDATSISLINRTFAWEGLIEQNTDVDMFGFTLDYNALLGLDIFAGIYGDYNLGRMATDGATLDILAKLYWGADETLLYTFDPYNTLGITFDDLYLQAGSYFLSIEGTGKEGVYTDYGSIGNYLVSGVVSYLPSDTPEPATLLIFGFGIAGASIVALRRRKR